MRRLNAPVPALVAFYLAAIVAANLTVAAFGPPAAVWNALLLVALDLVARDRLHDAWDGRGLPFRMGALIVAGGLVSYAAALALPGALPPALVGGVALASCAAFSAAAVADATAYQLARRLPWVARANLSNVAGATVDSVLFVGLAPVLGWGLLWPVAALQIAAKVAGGAAWSLALRPRRAPVEVTA